MTRTALPFSAPDLSALARSLERALAEHQSAHGRLPGHVEMMNLLARGAGQRNLQSLQAAVARQASLDAHIRAETALAADRAAQPASVDAWFDAPAPAATTEPTPPALSTHARQALQHFDAAGRLLRWPVKLSVQRLAMWVLWTRFDARRVYSEPEVNQVLKAWHLFGDHATLRRELINHKLMARRPDCSEYRKLVLQPDDEVQAVLRALRSSAHRRPRRTTRPSASAAA